MARGKGQAGLRQSHSILALEQKVLSKKKTLCFDFRPVSCELRPWDPGWANAEPKGPKKGRSGQKGLKPPSGLPSASAVPESTQEDRGHPGDAVNLGCFVCARGAQGYGFNGSALFCLSIIFGVHCESNF